MTRRLHGRTTKKTAKIARDWRHIKWKGSLFHYNAKEEQDGAIMPKLVTFRGRPVAKKTPLGGNKLRLTFYAPQVGQRGAQLVVTRTEWSRHGSEQFFPASAMPDVRALAAEAEAS